MAVLLGCHGSDTALCATRCSLHQAHAHDLHRPSHQAFALVQADVHSFCSGLKGSELRHLSTSPRIHRPSAIIVASQRHLLRFAGCPISSALCGLAVQWHSNSLQLGDVGVAM